MAVQSILVTDASGANVTINTLPAQGSANTANSLPVNLASDDALLALASNTGIVTKAKTQSIANCVIQTGQSVSSSVNLGTSRVVAISFPTGLVANAVTFQGSYDNTNFSNVFDESGTEKRVIAAANSFVVVTSSFFSGIRYLKVRTGNTASPNVVASNTTITLITEG